ncbi:hypothetical protein IQ07DRAFT_15290 [Pyrenochaeta sp. DS3sAY3a]|nr:hypothetical protein IQ07DRAFT_15290 [Pyrenochaeta sp. DS3sAY3a]
MAQADQPIKCKSCNRTLATVSPSGLVPEAAAPDTQSCDTCAQFSTLYEAMQAADLELANLSHKSNANRVKQDALEKSRKVHMEFGNWLFEVETPLTREKDHSSVVAPPEQITVAPVSQGTKRARSLSPVVQERSGEDGALTDAAQTEDLQSGAKQGLSLSIPHRPSLARSRSAADIHERKRARFSDSVETRADYPNYLTLNRFNDEYVPGRYAPPSEGYLDTSGADLGWVQFTGMRKIGGKFVEVKVDGEQGSSKVGSRKGQKKEKQESGEALEDPGEATMERDSRAERLARRTRRASVDSLSEDPVGDGEGKDTIVDAQE